VSKSDCELKLVFGIMVRTAPTPAAKARSMSPALEICIVLQYLELMSINSVRLNTLDAVRKGRSQSAVIRGIAVIYLQDLIHLLKPTFI